MGNQICDYAGVAGGFVITWFTCNDLGAFEAIKFNSGLVSL